MKSIVALVAGISETGLTVWCIPAVPLYGCDGMSLGPVPGSVTLHPTTATHWLVWVGTAHPSVTVFPNITCASDSRASYGWTIAATKEIKMK